MLRIIWKAGHRLGGPFEFGDGHGDADKGSGKYKLDAEGLEDIGSDFSGNAAELDEQVIGFFIPVNRKKLGGGFDIGIHIFQWDKDTAEKAHSQGDDIDNAG